MPAAWSPAISLYASGEIILVAKSRACAVIFPAQTPLPPPPFLGDGSERVLNTNNCGNRTTCQPAACGDAKAQTLGTKLAFGATNTDAWASEHVKESLAERDNTEVEGHADLEAYA